jgi:hypothetical protein
MAKRPRDSNQLAKFIVDIATGEAPDMISAQKRATNIHKRRGDIAGMRRVTLKWPLTGALFGAVGWLCLIKLLATALSQEEIRRGWKFVFIVLCPVAIAPGVGPWWLLALNCALYAIVFGGLGLIYSSLASSQISN